MAPKPVATSRPIDIVPAWRHPMLSIAIAVAEHGALQVRPTGAERRGVLDRDLDAKILETTRLEVISHIRRTSGAEVIRHVCSCPRIVCVEGA